MSFLKKYLAKHQSHLPLLVVIIVGLIVAVRNIKLGTYYTGWDNIHAEFNLWLYAKRVLTGAWLEHQGLGAPAGLAHASEIARLPILFLLKLLLPDNLVRYFFIFGMYLTGGIGMYLYLSKVWLDEKLKSFQNWVASLGGIFYLLHILTLQQFYISFELFTIQFAFFPFLLLTIHRLIEKPTSKSLLLFVLVQLLIAPSGHTPTLFYFGALFSIIYAFFVGLEKKGFLKAIGFTLGLGVMTFITNAYWIIPNVYYTYNNSHYVEESRENRLFAPESIASVKEASTYDNFMNNTQYLLTWKDYSFADQEYQYIFDDWLTHLSKPSVSLLLSALGKLTFLGVLITIVAKQRGYKRFAILTIYLLCAAFFWIDLFPTKTLFNYLYQNRSFQEAFRNPVTKLSVLYSVASVIVFIEVIAQLTQWFLKQRAVVGKIFSQIIILASFLTIGWVSLPTFQGYFISENLKVEYPTQYQTMFKYLQTRDSNLRVLPLPYLNHVGWEYYDWSFLGKGNGYQGMGFYFAGIPQPLLNRDTDRWVETSDFFSHELEHAVNTQSTDLFKNVITKYGVDLIIVDETKIKADSTEPYDYRRDHQLITAAGLKEVWHQDFLTIYERYSAQSENPLIVPASISLVSAHQGRVTTDNIYAQVEDYTIVPGSIAPTIYPFVGLARNDLQPARVSSDSTSITQPILKNKYQISIPGLKQRDYLTPANLSYENDIVTVTFPTTTITTNEESYTLPRIEDFMFEVKDSPQTIVVFFNDQGITLNQGQTAQPVLSLATGNTIHIAYLAKTDQFTLGTNGKVALANEQLIKAKELEPSWESITGDVVIHTPQTDYITITNTFPAVAIDLSAGNSTNCSTPTQGAITTTPESGRTIYSASEFGVNCNGHEFSYQSTAYSYLLKVVGETHRGRGVKLFVNYDDPNLVPEDYVFPNQKFDQTVALHALSSDPLTRLFVNWEVRSFGRDSEAQLNELSLVAFPLEQLSQMQLTIDGQPEPRPLNNSFKTKSVTKLPIGMWSVHYECAENPCYVGLDQSFDDAWVAIDTNSFTHIKHLRLNNWANLWELNEKEGSLVILYIPQLISSLCLLTVFILMIELVTKRHVKKNDYENHS